MGINKNNNIRDKIVHKVIMWLLFSLLGMLGAEGDYFSDIFKELITPGINSTKYITIVIIIILTFWSISFFSKRKKPQKYTDKKQETPDLC